MRASHFLLTGLLAVTSCLAAAERPPAPHAAAKTGPVKARPYLALDTGAVHALYMDGEFDEAIDQLERASQEGLLKTHADSVFTYKHLGVMYAANYETMEKGKSYMYRLLTIEPTVKILDMYASEMIYMIFRNVQAEFQVRTADPRTLTPPPESLAVADTARSRPKPAKVKRRTWPYWTAGAALALAGAGVATYFLIQPRPSGADHYEGGL